METLGYVMIGNKTPLIQKVNYLNFVYKKKLTQFICTHLPDVLKYIHVYSNKRNFVLVNILKSVFLHFQKASMVWIWIGAPSITKLKEANSFCQHPQTIVVNL